MSLEEKILQEKPSFLQKIRSAFRNYGLTFLLTASPLLLYTCGGEETSKPVPGCHSDDQCKGGRLCVDGECVFPEEVDGGYTCQDECSSNEKACEDNRYKTCGNYDSDSCLDWSSLTSCSSDEYCENGACKPQAPTCTDECSPSGLNQCFENGYKTCGNYDADECLDWSSLTACGADQNCQNGECLQEINCADLPDYSLVNGKCCTNSEQGNLICIKSFFVSPGYNVRGLAWDGEHLWHADWVTETIYKLTTTGEVVDSFGSPDNFPTGLAWDGQHLWHAGVYSYDDTGEYDYGRIYKLTTAGQVVDSFNSPGSNPRDLAWDGQYLWLNDGATESQIYKITPTGQVVDSFSPPDNLAGLTWDEQYLWGGCGSKIYKLTTTGQVVDSFTSPRGILLGLTWDGQHLWSAENMYNAEIYDQHGGIFQLEIIEE